MCEYSAESISLVSIEFLSRKMGWRHATLLAIPQHLQDRHQHLLTSHVPVHSTAALHVIKDLPALVQYHQLLLGTTAGIV